MRCRFNVLTALTAAVCVCGFTDIEPARAQGPGVLHKGSVSKIEIAVWDPETRDELANLQLGDTLELAAGQSVTIRLYAPRGHGPDNQRWYLPARFYVTKGGGASLSDVDRDKGSALLTAATGRRTAEVRYDLAEGIQVPKPYMEKGSFRVEVTAADSGIVGEPVPVEPEAPELGKAEEMVRRLFAGILMREANLDKADTEEWVDKVTRGYPALVDAAYEIVASEESRVKVAERGHSHRDRLLAIYEHLLDVGPREVDRYQWRDHLEMMVEGEVTAVVMDIVRSPEFRRVHGYNQ